MLAAFIGVPIFAVLRRERKRQGKTQDQVGRAIGTNRANFCLIENGRRTLSCDKFFAWCAYLGVDIVPHVIHNTTKEGE